jgi:hypothetical protein
MWMSPPLWSVRPLVEPLAGPEIERLITALLNATGAVHRVIVSSSQRPTADGVEVIGIAADRLRSILALLAEHSSDEDLALVTDVLAEATLLIADELGLSPALGDD